MSQPSAMSHVPIRRKSRQAIAARMANAAARKPAPAPHRVVLRVKRKRGDAAVESLLVATDEGGESGEAQAMPGRKRRATGIDSVEETMAELSLNKTVEAQTDCEQPRQDMEQQQITQRRRLIYKRVRTTEPDCSTDRRKEGRPSTVAAPSPPPHHPSGGGVGSTGGGRLDALLSSRGFNSAAHAPPPPAAVLDYMEVRRVKARVVSGKDISNTIGADPSTRGGHEQAVSNGVAPAEASRTAASAAVVGAHDFHVIDLHAVGRSVGAEMDTSGGVDEEGAGRGRAVEGEAGAAAERRVAAPILTPVERQMDEAIFTVRRKLF